MNHLDLSDDSIGYSIKELRERLMLLLIFSPTTRDNKSKAEL